MAMGSQSHTRPEAQFSKVPAQISVSNSSIGLDLTSLQSDRLAN
jgi:hypothetical protein